MMAFVVSAPVARRAKPLSLGRCHRPKKSDQIATSVSMQLTLGKTSLYTGIGILAGVLTNRLLLTPLDSLAMTQSRSDILGVITGATLILYGVGKAEIADAKKAVEMGGEFIRQGFTPDDTLSGEVEWAASATFAGVPNIRSFCVIANGVGQFFIGQFRDEEVAAVMVEGGTIDNSIASGKRAYLADMKTVPTKELEFGFLPSNCQVGWNYI